MGAVYFYHLTRSPLETSLPMLLTRAMQAGWRILVRGTDAQRMSWIDEKLWITGDESFLPHGMAGGPHDARQPVLLTQETAKTDGFQCLMSVDGADFDAQEAESLNRICVLFDGNDPAALNKARAQWKFIKDTGVEAQYWAQEGSGWAKKAEANVSE